MEKNELDSFLFSITLYLKEYEQICVIDEEETEVWRFPEIFYKIVSAKRWCKKVLILTTSSDIACSNSICKRITAEEYSYLRSVYEMYEYSNRVTMVSLKQNCGSIFNYLTHNFFTIEEVVEAILH